MRTIVENKIIQNKENQVEASRVEVPEQPS